jgi:cyclase
VAWAPLWCCVDKPATRFRRYRAFLAAIQKTALGKMIRRVLITHHHGDHIWRLPFFPRTEILTHPYCRQAMLETPIPSPVWEKRDGWAEGGEPRKIVPPTTIFNDKLIYYYGNMPVELMFSGPAHTWGDVMVYLPQQKILFAGRRGHGRDAQSG